MLPRSWMPSSTFRRSTCCLIGSNRFVDTEHGNSILPKDKHKHIKRTSRTVGTPPITISTPRHKWSPICVAFYASKWESSITKPSLGVGRTVLLPAKSSLPLLIRLPPRAPSHMRSLNSWDPKTNMVECILTLWSKTSEHYSTIRKAQCTAWHYSAAHGSISSIRVVTRHICRMNNCMQ